MTHDDEEYFNLQELLELFGFPFDDDNINDLGEGYEPESQPF